MASRREARRIRSAGPRWLGRLFTLIPAILLLAGLGLLAEAVVFVIDAESTRGRVVDIRRNYSSDNGASYTPTIRYRRDDGRAFEAETHIASSGYDYDIGQRVDILYSRDEPEEVRVDSFFSLYGPGLIVAVVGALFLSIVSWVRRRNSRGTERGQEADASGDDSQDRPWPGMKTESKPRTTDPSIHGHAHEPKPKYQPTVRRMR